MWYEPDMKNNSALADPCFVRALRLCNRQSVFHSAGAHEETGRLSEHAERQTRTELSITRTDLFSFFRKRGS